MKNVVKIILIVLVIMSLCTTVQAVGNCKIDLQPVKAEVKKGDEVAINVNISNIKAEKGIIAMTATIEYDKNSFEFVKVEGKKWTTPFFNEENGKLAVDCNDYTTSDETMFEIVFKVKETNTIKKTITIKDIVLSNGIEDINTTNASTTISVRNDSVTPVPPDTDNPDENQGGNQGGNQDGNQSNNQDNNSNGSEVENSNQNQDDKNENNNKIDNTVSNEKLPHTGGKLNIIFSVFGIIIILIVIILIVTRTIKKKNKN